MARPAGFHVFAKETSHAGFSFCFSFVRDGGFFFVDAVGSCYYLARRAWANAGMPVRQSRIGLAGRAQMLSAAGGMAT